MIGRRRFGLGAAALWISTGAHAQSAKSALRVVPQAEPLVFDPHQQERDPAACGTGLRHAIQLDADMVPRPQMVETWSKSWKTARRWTLHTAPRPEVP